MKTLKDLFVHTLQDVYYAEQRIMESLPMMIEKAETNELRNVLNAHLAETEKQIQRLDEVFELVDETPSTEECEAVDGLLEEAEEVMSEIDDKSVLDAGIIAAGQAVEHYEIARYGTLIAWADQIGLGQAKSSAGTDTRRRKTCRQATDRSGAPEREPPGCRVKIDRRWKHPAAVCFRSSKAGPFNLSLRSPHLPRASFFV